MDRIWQLKKMKISKEDMEYIESLDYEVVQRNNIIRYIRENKIPIAEEKIIEYNKDYINFVVERQLFLEKLVDLYSDNKNKDYLSIRADFDACILFWHEWED